MFSLVTLKRSPWLAAISSRAGAIIPQGPHQGGQKSTSTGLSDCSTSVTKVVGLMLVGWFICLRGLSGALQRPRAVVERVVMVVERGEDQAGLLLGDGREEEVREAGFLRHFHGLIEDAANERRGNPNAKFA